MKRATPGSYSTQAKFLEPKFRFFSIHAARICHEADHLTPLSRFVWKKLAIAPPTVVVRRVLPSRNGPKSPFFSAG